MGLMKEQFIKDREAELHIDDEYHYKKWKKLESKEESITVKRSWLESLKDFDVWKEWKHKPNIYSDYEN